MTKEELAARLTGRAIGQELTAEDEASAKLAGLVVVYGGHDWLVEVRGAIHADVGDWPGGGFLLTQDGVWQDADECPAQCRHFQQAKDVARARGSLINPYIPMDGYSWCYETAIPHATFELMEEGKPFCLGMVFALEDIGRPPA